MDLLDLGSRAFRSRLKRELPRWRDEGWIDERVEAELFERYDLGEEGVSVAAATIYVLGALLIGAGILSFVAWNWELMSRAVKLGILGLMLVAAHSAGYWMWRVADRLPRLGHALTLLGSLIFGASIGLVYQMFHITTDPAAGWGMWAIGAGAAAWALRSVPNGALAAVVAVIWGCVYLAAHEGLFGLVPFLVAVPFLPLAWLCRSSFLFVVVSLGALVVMAVSASIEFDGGAGFVVSTLDGAALLLAYSLTPAFEKPARALGLFTASAVFYLCSFREVAEAFAFGRAAPSGQGWMAFVLPAYAGTLVLVARNMRTLREHPAMICALAGIPVVLWGLAIADGAVAGSIAANLGLAALSIVSITSAARTLRRAPFWFGSLLGGTLILSRFLEFETDLWLKAIVFLACGVAVIAFGVAFERRRKRG
ncbi:MAG: DUF2157 domain-containing protein [Planctomycetota bacterium]|nr:DUF2157 domain-containing protein [Planctomycetota bacterium]